MKKYIIILFAIIGSFANAQGYDFQQLCLNCAEQNGFYCGDDPANWTQYSPEGCVPNGEGGLFYLNDGWEDCADGSDEAEAVPTTVENCGPVGPPPCDTVYVDVPVIQYEYIFDTIVEYETVIEYDTIVETEYIYNVDTVYADVLDTMFIDVVEYVEIFVIDTVVEIQYEEIVEYIDCDSGLPCNTSIMEIVDKSKQNSVIYNIKGQAILTREGLYIENGKIYYKTK
tara:strand:- start:7 stop:687 length:681 start_codon:yes stop_codon:yes gene_type:complete